MLAKKTQLFLEYTIIYRSFFILFIQQFEPSPSRQQFPGRWIPISHKDSDGKQLEIDRLLEKKSLTEEEFELLKKYTAEQAVKLTDNWRSIDIYKSSTYKKIRQGSILWLCIVWGLFLVLVPVGKLEFLEVVILPVLFGLSGLILKLELIIIVALAVVIYLIKSQYVPKKKENGGEVSV